MKKIFIILFFFILIVSVYSAKSYRILSRGAVIDNSTNLIWTRCPLTTNDKPMYDFNCSEEKKLFSWDEAIDACRNLVHEGRSDWRLPNISELQSIVYYYHYTTGETNLGQVIESVFPKTITKRDLDADFSILWGLFPGYCWGNTCNIHYWSSTTKDGVTALSLNFNLGNVHWDVIDKYKSVRCVAGP